MCVCKLNKVKKIKTFQISINCERGKKTTNPTSCLGRCDWLSLTAQAPVKARCSNLFPVLLLAFVAKPETWSDLKTGRNFTFVVITLYKCYFLQSICFCGKEKWQQCVQRRILVNLTAFSVVVRTTETPPPFNIQQLGGLMLFCI